MTEFAVYEMLPANFSANERIWKLLNVYLILLTLIGGPISVAVNVNN